VEIILLLHYLDKLARHLTLREERCACFTPRLTGGVVSGNFSQKQLLIFESLAWQLGHVKLLQVRALPVHKLRRAASPIPSRSLNSARHSWDEDLVVAYVVVNWHGAAKKWSLSLLLWLVRLEEIEVGLIYCCLRLRGKPLSRHILDVFYSSLVMVRLINSLRPSFLTFL
jgi:hypothetical protein